MGKFLGAIAVLAANLFTAPYLAADSRHHHRAGQQQAADDCTGINAPIRTLSADGSKTWTLPNTARWCSIPELAPQDDPTFQAQGGSESQ